MVTENRNCFSQPASTDVTQLNRSKHIFQWYEKSQEIEIISNFPLYTAGGT